MTTSRFLQDENAEDVSTNTRKSSDLIDRSYGTPSPDIRFNTTPIQYDSDPFDDIENIGSDEDETNLNRDVAKAAATLADSMLSNNTTVTGYLSAAALAEQEQVALACLSSPLVMDWLRTFENMTTQLTGLTNGFSKKFTELQRFPSNLHRSSLNLTELNQNNISGNIARNIDCTATEIAKHEPFLSAASGCLDKKLKIMQARYTADEIKTLKEDILKLTTNSYQMSCILKQSITYITTLLRMLPANQTDQEISASLELPIDNAKKLFAIKMALLSKCSDQAAAAMAETYKTVAAPARKVPPRIHV